MMKQFGCEVVHEGAVYQIPADDNYVAGTYQIEPDVSAACYFYAAAALTGGYALVKNVRYTSMQGDMKFLPMIFGTGMTIGLVSVVNTFLHIRTPFLLSLLRTGWGILFGLLIGTAVVIVAELIYRLVRRICGVTNG